MSWRFHSSIVSANAPLDATVTSAPAAASATFSAEARVASGSTMRIFTTAAPRRPSPASR